MRVFQVLALVAIIALAGVLGWREYQLNYAPRLALPALELTGLEGRASFDPAGQSQAYLINVLSADCFDCSSEMPVLSALAAEGITLYGLFHGEDADAANLFLDEYGDPFAGVMMTTGDALLADFGTSGLPFTVIVSNEGEIISLVEGAIDVSVLQSKIYPALEREARRSR
jgi:cytochrome c biogenesis protein CcmG/thiol:disulfide interchange protein DsbE